MESQTLQHSVRALQKASRSTYMIGDPLMRCLAPRLSRPMATKTRMPQNVQYSDMSPPMLRRQPPVKEVPVTVYSFPEFEPLRFASYPENHLNLPVRRDILQRAVVFEADNARQGTANTKWRDEIHGSHRKLRQQKGLGMARLGSKTSPMLRGGASAFGPKPRDFSSKLPRKIYDLAWRTALSYRYKKGELIVVQKFDDEDVTGPRLMDKIIEWNQLGKPLVITRRPMDNLTEAMKPGEGARDRKPGLALPEVNVDVKDLLSLGRLIIEKRALDSILKNHSSDLNTMVATAIYE
ncbi:uncharacterized protein KY384_004910 [Bacidia gigantensis]|uniref:uncharacterized protein n=1 Tax=Bacidia gigantensis TaxID=2732470 RepID=UPI001D0535AE|nr:uncharacterized protein KY384_004910 [Bacidia gigantensis]KAG8530408.1 hypothetical protein KY384_004910 [Bacidia gigantensis]